MLTIAGGILIAVAALVALAAVIAVIAACWEEIMLPALGIAAILGALCGVGGPLALWLARNWVLLLLGVGMVAGWIGFLYVLGRAASVVARKLRKYPWFIF